MEDRAQVRAAEAVVELLDEWLVEEDGNTAESLEEQLGETLLLSTGETSGVRQWRVSSTGDVINVGNQKRACGE